MLKRFVRIFGGDPNKREIEKTALIIDEINRQEPQFEALSDQALRAKTDEFRSRLANGETLDDLLPEAFAAVREASKRTIGLRHYDVQLIGGIVLHQGKIAEMRTGEGKTLVATLPQYLNALTGKGIHLITVNDYLARRDARWMAPIYNALGMNVGVLQMAARTENGKKAFIVDLERESPHEDQHQLRMVPRQEAYSADITYGTNSEFGFDYLRDNMAWHLDDRVQRGHYYAIIDEVDNVLIDEARTPLIISGPAQDEAEWYVRMAQVIRQLRPEDYEVIEKDRTATLTEIGEARVEELLGMALRDPDRPEDVTLEQARMLGYLEQGMRAQYLFKRNKDYLVQAGKVIIVDEFTGRMMPGRRWSDGLHQAVEAKEGVRVQAENVTYATITIQNFFRMYEKLAGMSGTAVTEAEEFDKIYKLGVVAIPTNLEYQAMSPESDLEELEARDEDGYKYNYYSKKEDIEKAPVFWRRKDYPDIVYRTEETKLRSITQEILYYHTLGRPILVGTTSVELSERLSARLRAEPLRRLAQVLLIRDAWFVANQRDEDGRQVAELQFLNFSLDELDIAQMRKMGRDLNLSFNPEEAANLNRLEMILKLGPTERDRLIAVLKAGIPHQVLNARKHTEESQIIARAGAFGAVTIATNMAGRGVDIKLGGDMPEDILANANRVLSRANYKDPYDMSLDERLDALTSLDPSAYGIYESEVSQFIQYVQDMERVRNLGGLHVIGSERHEARRIDNQLRGRSARQGDPGSSRFYLSMEDNLMRMFGGQQADGLMQRLKIDDAIPIEFGMVGRIVEQSQTRVEGANFDVRKHLLEYDDVLNTQRGKIYAQRNRIFTKEDLSEDVVEMLRTEVMSRVPEAIQESDGPWKLLAWLEQIQPPLQIDNLIFPSYTLKLLLDYVAGDKQTITTKEAIDALSDIAKRSLLAEEDHLVHTVSTLLDQTQARLKTQIDERVDAVDTFFEGLTTTDDDEPVNTRQFADELSATARISLRLSAEQLRALRDQDKDEIDSIRSDVISQIETNQVNQALTRLVGSIERRLEEPLELNPSQVSTEDWDLLADQILDAIQSVYNRRRERLIGSGGQIITDLESALARANGYIPRNSLVHLLMLLPQGARAAFDKKTHRRIVQRTTRLSYTYFAAQLLENRSAEEISESVLSHLEQAQSIIHQAWGLAEWKRISTSSIIELDETTQNGLRNILEEETYTQAYNQPLTLLNSEQTEAAVKELGRQMLTEIYRQLLLQVITELWVEYLTQMEALRVSIGLEAYAQRDPLVQYKNRAFELFQNLLRDMRIGVVSRMFTYRPRDLSSVQTTVKKSEAPEIEPEVEMIPVAPEIAQKSGTQQSERSDAHSKKRRRHRR